MLWAVTAGTVGGDPNTFEADPHGRWRLDRWGVMRFLGSDRGAYRLHDHDRDPHLHADTPVQLELDE